MVFQSPRLTTEALDRYYRHEYHRRRHSSEPDPDKDNWVQVRRSEHLVSVAASHQSNFRRHLDIGSSSGELLHAFSTAFGSDPHGVEPSETDRAEAISRGISTHPDLGDLPSELAGTFDLITMSHVLEHLPDPSATLRSIRQEWLSPEGLLLIEVPNLYAHPSFEPAHLIAFSQDTLARILASSGYEVREIRRHGKPYSRLLPLFLLAVARPSSSPIEVEVSAPSRSRIRLLRWIGMARLRIIRFIGRVLLGRKKLQPWAR